MTRSLVTVKPDLQTLVCIFTYTLYDQNWDPNPTFPFQFPSPSILPPPLGAIPAGTCNWPKAAAKGFVSTGLLPGPPGATPPPGNGIPGGGPSGIPGSGPPNVIPPKFPDRPND